MARRRGLLAGFLALLLAVPGLGTAEAVEQPSAPVDATNPVELTHLRTESTEVYADSSGMRTLVAHPSPVRARRGKDWVPIDTTLHRGADGTVRPGATVTGLALSGGGDRALVTLTDRSTSLGLTWPTALPKPELEGDTATYREVFPGVDLGVRAEPDGFAQFLVVKNRTAAERLTKIDFGLTTAGLRVQDGPAGSTVAVDNNGRPVLSADKAVMWDSAARTRRCRPDGPVPG